MNSDVSTPTAISQLEVFYDGACPLCLKEVQFLRKADPKGRIHFVDIASESFRPSDFGPSMDQFMAEIHGRLPDGSWVQGVEVFRRIYGLLGLGPLVWCTRLPLISGILDAAYRLFARNRLRLTGRCSTTSCNVSASKLS
jgi:predicted DCC family thiol-disulfide oxidoreductase YuxK